MMLKSSTKSPVPSARETIAAALGKTLLESPSEVRFNKRKVAKSLSSQKTLVLPASASLYDFGGAALAACLSALSCRLIFERIVSNRLEGLERILTSPEVRAYFETANKTV